METDLHKFDPFRPVDWRARRLAERGADDGQDEALAQAVALQAGRGKRAFELESRLLTDESFQVIAEKTGVAPATVARYEHLFFNVRRDGRRAGTDWLMSQLFFTGSWDYREPPVYIVWRYAALAGGPLLLDLVVAEHERRVEPNIPDRALVAELIRFLVRLQFTPLSDTEASAALHAELRRLMRAGPLDPADAQLWASVRPHVEFLATAWNPRPRVVARDRRRRRLDQGGGQIQSTNGAEQRQEVCVGIERGVAMIL